MTDFVWDFKGLTVKKTGARINFTPALLREVGVWFRFFFAVTTARREDGPAFSVAFVPERARPWYMIWPTLKLAGARFVRDSDTADIVVHFDDVTVCTAPQLVLRPGQRGLNLNCKDISKTAVSEAFAQVFGYDVGVDPETHHGLAVEKAELNGAHDGRIITCPAPAKPGCSYQRVIDNTTKDGSLVEDLRTTVVDGRPVCVFAKLRPVGSRFSNSNSSATLLMPEDVFTPAECAQIGAFAQAIGLDYGGLDVLRDRSDGRIYIVDANKTDLGPTRTLPVSEQVRATRLLAQAVRAFLLRPMPTGDQT